MGTDSGTASGTEVDTVGGPVATADLGVTLMHEHVFVLSPEIIANYPEGWGDEQAREDAAVEKLNALKAIGVDTIVDPTVIGLGRYIPRIQRIAERTALRIIVATGLYTYNDVPLYFHFTGPGTAISGPEAMVEMFVRDITEGIAGTGVRAAILKCATDEPGVTAGVERVLRAVAQAHRATGVPITTHTHAHSRRGLDQQRIFTQEGVDLNRVVIGHSGDSTDVDYLEELIAAGSYLGMDRFGLDNILASRTVSTSWRGCANAAMPIGWCWRTTHPAISTGFRKQHYRWCCPTGTICTSTTMCCPPCGSVV